MAKEAYKRKLLIKWGYGVIANKWLRRNRYYGGDISFMLKNRVRHAFTSVGNFFPHSDKDTALRLLKPFILMNVGVDTLIYKGRKFK